MMTIHRLSISDPYISVSLIVGKDSREYVGLIDTGASMTAVHPRIIADLRPNKTTSVDDKQPGQPSRFVPVYYFKMVFGGITEPLGVEAIPAEPSSPCDLLIGRELISRWVVTMDGPQNRKVVAI
jgi:predicted aspartyl protease